MKRDKQLNIKLNQKEFEKVEVARDDLSVSEYVRKCLFDDITEKMWLEATLDVSRLRLINISNKLAGLKDNERYTEKNEDILRNVDDLIKFLEDK